MGVVAFLSPSAPELIVILIIALLVLGPSRLPETARSLGRGMRELRETLQGIGDHNDEDEDDDGGSAEIAPTPPRRDDPGGLPVDPAVVMGDVPYDDDLPDELPVQPEAADYQKEAESSTPSASS